MAAQLLKFVIALALWPLLAGEIWTLIDLARLSVPAGEWRSTWFLCLAAGFVVWLLIYAFLPRAMWIYVLGHEFTHALAAMISGGKVSAFHVTSKGGHILTDRVSWWIALSPYFVPLYALVWTALWITVQFYYPPLREWQPILYFGIGLTWAFHVTFTASMMHFRQTDLSGEGFIFSWTVILALNLIAVLFLLAFMVPEGFAGAARRFASCVAQSYVITGIGFTRGAEWAVRSWQTHRFQKPL
jgi:hypothetical protein